MLLLAKVFDPVVVKLPITVDEPAAIYPAFSEARPAAVRVDCKTVAPELVR